MTITVRVGERIPDTVFYIGLRDQADNSLTCFNSPQEVLGALDPGYLSAGAAGDREAFTARHHLAVGFIAAAHDQLKADDVRRLSEEERMALSARGARAVDDLGTWPGQVPLYVLATLHQPYTLVPLPSGDEVHPIDPYTEGSLVGSLADAGLLDAWPARPGQVWNGGQQ